MKLKKDLIFGLTLIAVALVSRVLPHWPNFTAVIAVSVIAGHSAFGFSSFWKALLVPTIAMLIGDLIFGFHPMQLFVYLPIWLTVLISMNVSRLQRFQKGAFGGLVSGLISAFSGGLLFFVISNFGIWLIGSFYDRSWEGLLACFLAAIPFYGYQISGDVVYTTLGISVLMGVIQKISRAESARAWN